MDSFFAVLLALWIAAASGQTENKPIRAPILAAGYQPVSNNNVGARPLVPVVYPGPRPHEIPSLMAPPMFPPVLTIPAPPRVPPMAQIPQFLLPMFGPQLQPQGPQRPGMNIMLLQQPIIGGGGANQQPAGVYQPGGLNSGFHPPAYASGPSARFGHFPNSDSRNHMAMSGTYSGHYGDESEQSGQQSGQSGQSGQYGQPSPYRPGQLSQSRPQNGANYQQKRSEETKVSMGPGAELEVAVGKKSASVPSR